MRLAKLALLTLTVATATAGHAADSYAIGNRVLVVGDSAGKLVELAGAPVHKEVVENKFGAQQAERWEYRREGKTLLVTIQDGKVARIDEVF